MTEKHSVDSVITLTSLVMKPMAILKLMYERKLLVGVIVLSSTSLAVLYAKRSPDIYRSEALLMPAESAQSNMNNLIRQYGGIASLAGIQLGGDTETSKSKVAAQIIYHCIFLISWKKNCPLVRRCWLLIDGMKRQGH